jgi:Flp pilus assembly protein TadG
MRLTPPRRGATNSGQVLPFVVFALVALLALVSLGIDGGHAYAVRRQMQNAADASSLAGARLLCSSQADADILAEILTYAAYNHVTSNNVIVYYTDSDGKHVGTALPKSGTAPAGAVGIEVTARTSTASFFGGVVGFKSFRPQATAAARSTCLLPAIFAYESNLPMGSKVIDWSGGNYTVKGVVHSNSDLNMSGTGNTINGPTETVTGSSPNAPSVASSVQPYPVSYNADDYAPGGSQAQAAGNDYHYIPSDSNLSQFVNNGVLQSGLYYVTGNVNFSAPSVAANVTIVASGYITISSSGSAWTPYAQGLLFLANISDASAPGHIALNVSGSNSSWAGVIFAPQSGIRMSGSSNTTLRGSLIGWTVTLTGSGLQVASGSSPAGIYLYE